MESLIIKEETGGKWILRPQGAVFPITQGSRDDVLRFVDLHYGERAAVLRFEKQSGEVEEMLFSARSLTRR
jgi:hypothetical protein